MRKLHAILLSGTLLVTLGTSYAQQTSSAGSDATVAAQINQLREALNAQQQQIAQQQQEIERLRQQVTTQQVSGNAATSAPRVVDAALHTAAPEVAAATTVSDSPQEPSSAKEKESPLSFRIGGADFTPGGFVDFSTFYRSVNVGSGVSTTFGTIPFNNTVQGEISELRMTAQHSRLSLRMDSAFGANKVTGYVEADFLGNDAGSVFVTSNSHTNRLRHYWLDLHHNKWEILGGQAYSWLTPNRNGLSPVPSDVMITQNVDPNYQIGLSWTRAAQFRLAYHPNEHWGFGVALENPQQYIGAAGEVTFPAVWSALLGAQFDNGTSPGTPNLHPDIIPKVAYDTDFMGGHHFHAEAAGLVTTVRIANLKIISPPFAHDSATGLGGEFAANVDLIKDRVKLLGNAFISEGGGRYIFGLGPDAVVRPDPTGGPANTISLVHSRSGVVGIETKLLKNTQVSGYFGAAYFERNSFVDITSPINIVPPQVLSCDNKNLVAKPCIGFGGGNSSNFANRLLQEATLDITQTFWKSKQYGSLQLLTQFSWAQRNPWFVALGAPKDAHTTMGWVNLRYIIP